MRPAETFLYTGGVDAAYGRALESGTTPIKEPADRPAQGDRRAGVTDPFGNIWFLAARIEDVSREALQERHDDRAQRRGRTQLQALFVRSNRTDGRSVATDLSLPA